MDTLLLIDGYSLVHRAFYAMPPLANADGVYTNAVFGFFNMLLRVLREAQPQYLCVALDAHAKTFRHERFEAYKGTRRPMPEELRPQLALLRETLDAIGIHKIEIAGFEADDILGTLAKRAEERGLRSVIVSGDRDTFQLVDRHTEVWMTRKGISEIERLTPETLKAEYGIESWQVPDLKGLMGDASDNIPGVPGVGEKTALKLILEHQNIEKVLEAAAGIKGKLGERLRENGDKAVLSKWLATIDRDAPIEDEIDSMCTPPLDRAREPFKKLRFASLLERLPKGEIEAPPERRQTHSDRWREPLRLASPEAIQKAFEGASAGEWALFEAGGALFIAAEDGFTAEIALGGGDLLQPGLDDAQAFEALRPLLESPAKKRVFDGKNLRTRLTRQGIGLNGELFDAALAAYLLRAGQAQSAGQLMAARGRDLAPGGFYELCDEMLEELKGLDMLSLYEDIELPLADVLFAMEQAGFRVDRGALGALQAEFGAKLMELQARIHDLAGKSFNINSPKQLGELLFETLKLPSGRKTKSGYSTDAEVLEGIADLHPIVSAVLEYRGLSKLQSTYVDGLLALSGRDSIIHTSLNQTVTLTGRISSAEPNLQNIPVRTELGRVIRKVFVPREGNLLVDADYSQIELRVLAHMAGETNMIAAFQNGEDIHASTAAQVYGVKLGEVTSAMRSSAKAVNFGIVYGISDFGLAKNIGVSRREAAEFIERYFGRYPAVKRFMEACVLLAREQGYVSTMFGRRRNIPEIRSSNYNTRSFGERAAMNTPIQGSAADIIKIAMVRVHRALEAEGFGAKLILQVHDELIVDAPEAEAEAAAGLLQREMQAAAALCVPLIADVKIGRSWYETK
ncbi:MAG: DNA polymerase I [Christensenellaceae bacterium]|jgi:DNA polymerase-1|nr:DNA polymerase I [Christensenellaceae bacterium]